MEFGTMRQFGTILFFSYAAFSSVSIAGSSFAIISSAICALWLFYRDQTLVCIPKGFSKAFFLFLLTFAVSAIFAQDPSVALMRIGTNLWRMFPMVLAIVFLRNAKQVGWFIITMTISIMIADFLAIWQGVHGIRRATAFSTNAMILAGYLVLMISSNLVLNRFFKPKNPCALWHC